MKSTLSICVVAASLAFIPCLTRADDSDTSVKKVDKTKTVEKDEGGTKVTKEEHKEKVDQGAVEHREDHHDRKIDEREHRDREHLKAEERDHLDGDHVKTEKDVRVHKDGAGANVEVDKTKKVEKD